MMLSERNQTHKKTHILGDSIHLRSRIKKLIEIESRFLVAEGGGGEWGDRGLTANRYIVSF